jgi:hypothetical protein
MILQINFNLNVPVVEYQKMADFVARLSRRTWTKVEDLASKPGCSGGWRYLSIR